MIPFPNLKVAGAGGSAVKWTDADPTWTISNGGLTASRPSNSSTNTLVRATPYARTIGPAAFSITVDGTDGGTNPAVGLFPPTASLNPVDTTNRVVWRPDGTVNINGTEATAAATFTNGDVLTFRLVNSSGTSITFLKNGTVVGTYTIAAVSRCPAANANLGPGPVITINGAPAGETAWG